MYTRVVVMLVEIEEDDGKHWQNWMMDCMQKYEGK